MIIFADLSNYQPSITFDFDGTICAETGDFEVLGPPIPAMVERIKRSKAAGIKVIIQSARWSVHHLNDQATADKWRELGRQWLELHDVPFDELRSGKEISKAYVDDKAVRADDFQSLDDVIDRAAKLVQTQSAISDTGVYLMGLLPNGNEYCIAEKIMEWGKQMVPEEILYTKEGENFGRETEPHVTIIYGVPHEKARVDLERFLGQAQKFPAKISLGKITKFRPEKEPFDVLKVDVDSDDLTSLNSLLDSVYGTTNNDYPDYHPHITIAYLKKGEGEHLVDDESFSGQDHLLGKFVCKVCEKPDTVFEYIASAENPVSASLIDYPRMTMPEEIWEIQESPQKGLPKLKPEIKDAIISAMHGIVDQNFKDRESWLYTLVMGSSLATQFWNEDTDLDIKFIIDTKAFKAANPEYAGLHSDELTKKLSKFVKEYEGRYELFGHPLEFFVLSKKHLLSGDVAEDYDSLYDVLAEKWIKEPPLVDPHKWDRDRVVNPGAKLASVWARRWDERFGKIRRDVRELDLLVNYLKQMPVEFQETWDSKQKKLLGSLAKEIRHLIAEKERVMATRRGSYRREKRGPEGWVNDTPEIIQLKMLAHWGYFAAIKKLKTILNDRETVAPEDAPSIAAVFNVEAPTVVEDETMTNGGPDEVKAAATKLTKDQLEEYLLKVGSEHDEEWEWESHQLSRGADSWVLAWIPANETIHPFLMNLKKRPFKKGDMKPGVAHWTDDGWEIDDGRHRSGTAVVGKGATHIPMYIPVKDQVHLKASKETSLHLETKAAKKKVILVTGSSSGIGQAIAKKFSEDGHRIVITYNKNKKGAEETKEACDEIGAGSTKILHLDVTKDSSIKSVMESVVKEYDGLDILVNNAGVFYGDTFDKLKDGQIEEILATNLEGLIKMTAEALPHIRESIVNIASVNSLEGNKEMNVYAASKFGVRGFTQSLAKEQRGELKVWLINPDATATRMSGWTGRPPERVADVVHAVVTGKLKKKPGEDINIADEVGKVKAAKGFPDIERTPEELGRAAKAGLVEFTADLGGTTCGSCIFFKADEGFCSHQELMMAVSGPQECCNFWENPEKGKYIEAEKKKEVKAEKNYFSFWIDPNGKVFEVEYDSHDRWIEENKSMLSKKYGVTKISKDFLQRVENLVSQGWTRISDMGQGVVFIEGRVESIPKEIKEAIIFSDVSLVVYPKNSEQRVPAAETSEEKEILLKASLRQDVMQAIGEASMAWSETPKGVFESRMAERIGEELIEKIRKSKRWQAWKVNLNSRGLTVEAGLIIKGMSEMEQVVELMKVLEDSGFEVVTRYGEKSLPNPDTMCHGQCEGTGVVPVCYKQPENLEIRLIEEESDPDLIRLWEEAEAKSHAEDGWHFVTCPECSGTGKQVLAAKTKDKFTRLYREANKAVQADPLWLGSLDDPVKAQEFGILQSEISDARDEDSLKKTWFKFKPSVSWEALEQMAETDDELVKV